MSDIGKIPGEKGPRGSEDPKRKKGPDSEAFKEMMKVGKVREVDPDEKKKRKSQAEAEEEIASLKGTPLHQGLDAQDAPPPSFSEEGSQGGVEASGPKSSPQPPSASPPQYEPGSTDQTRKTKKKKQVGQQPPLKTKKTKNLTQSRKKKAPITGAKLVEPSAQQAQPITKKTKPQELKTQEKKEESPIEVPTQLPLPPSPLPPGSWEATKELDKKEETTTPPVQVEAHLPDSQLGTPPAIAETTPPPLAAPFAKLPTQIIQIFERMVGVMTVMNETGITETTINLNNPQYAHSVFYGAQIVISEFSTAPKQFNIELSATSQALNLMGANTEELVAAFQAGQYNFKVNRIDLSQLRSRGEIKRKQVGRVKRKKSGGG